MTDTIVAISTALGVGAIAIIRVSGKDSIKIVNNIFKGKNLLEVESHTINHGYIVNNEETIDEVLVSVFKSPKTYTMENIVEINSHGGIATTNKIVEILLNSGCRLAEPGEFTKRAFLNGRIDLLEAEGVMDLINSKTQESRNLAINQVQGKVSNMISELRENILQILANIEVNIDYPEYEDIKEYTVNDLKLKIDELDNRIRTILKESENAKIIKEGINVGIIGKPNVGKSSLLNKLIEEEKAIVTDIKGTTRDFVEGTVNINGLVLNLIDTAGIRKTNDLVEKIGVNKSLDLINKTDLILLMLNNNETINKEEIDLIKKIKDKKHIILVNKIDLKNKLDLTKLDNYINISINNNIGIDKLKETIINMFNLDQFKTKDMTYLTNSRTISILKNIIKSIEDVKNGIDKNLPIDMIEIDIKFIWEQLGNIIGETYEDELINKLFSQFCLGK